MKHFEKTRVDTSEQCCQPTNMVLVFSTDVSIKDHPDMKTQIVVTFGATEIKDWDGTEKANNGKLVKKRQIG